LARVSRLTGGFLFHGPRRGRLKPDVVRRTLVNDVLTPLSSRFATAEGEVGFEHCRLHSFRHYFVSMCVQKGVPERTTMRWVGHNNGSLVNHYYHLHDDESRRQMDRLDKFHEESPGGGAGAMVS
jgi:integrase